MKAPWKLSETRAATVPFLNVDQSHMKDKSEDGHDNFSFSLKSLIRQDGTFRVLLRRSSLWRSMKIYVLKDIFHSLLSLPFKFLVLLVAGIYLLSFALFAALYIAMPWGTIKNVNNWADAFWFSHQTQYSIGYGYYAPHSSTLGNSVVLLQVVVGVLIDSIAFGVFYSKFARPTSRRSAIFFSDDLCVYDGSSSGLNGLNVSEVPANPTLSFRVMNLRRHALVEPKVQVFFVERGSTGSGSIHIEELKDLQFSIPIDFMNLPVTVSHEIDENSPLHIRIFNNNNTPADTSAVNIIANLFEIPDGELVVVVTGCDADTGDIFQARKSYLLDAESVRVNYRFCGSVSVEDRTRCVNLDAFNNITRIEGLSSPGFAVQAE